MKKRLLSALLVLAMLLAMMSVTAITAFAETETGVEVSSDLKNGKVTVEPEEVAVGEDVVLTVIPDDGFVLDTLTVLDGNGNELEVKCYANGVYVFEMPEGKVTVSATFKESDAYASCPKDATCPMVALDDLDVSAWYHDGIHYCLDNGLMSGVGDAKFDPAGTITRAMIVTMLWRLEGQPYLDYYLRFEDVPSGQWFTSAVRWAAAEKIVSGYDAEHFGPNDPVTREQLAAILYNYAKNKEQGFTGSWMFLLDYADRANISSWADEAAHWCSMKSIITGKDGMVFDPQGYATRAEAATMMQRFCTVLSQ